jgi:hypothetical protein
MDGQVSALAVAGFLAFFVKAALDRVATLVRVQWPAADLSLPLGVAAIAIGGGLGWLAQVNVLAGLPLDPLLGRVLTAVAIGLGVEFLNDVLTVVQGRSGGTNASAGNRTAVYRAEITPQRVRGW